MRKFKVGDKVKCIIGVGNLNLKYQVGIIKQSDGYCIGVEFENFIKGHSGNDWGYKGKEGHCWNVSDRVLELLVPAKTMEYGIAKFCKEMYK